AWVAGCGLGTTTLARDTLAALIEQRAGAPLVLDADGLNLLAAGRLPDWGEGVVVLTPHPAEAARLLNVSTPEVQGDRLGAARGLATRHSTWVVLKGPGTLVCRPDGHC